MITFSRGTIKTWAQMLARCYGSAEAAYDKLTDERWWADIRTEELPEKVSHWDMEEERQMLRDELGVMAFGEPVTPKTFWGRDMGDEA